MLLPEEIKRYCGKSLFKGSSNSSIELSDSAANYTYLEVVYYITTSAGETVTSRTKVKNGETVALAYYTSATEDIGQYGYNNISINDKIIKFINGGYMNFTASAFRNGNLSNKQIYIKEVIGYRQEKEIITNGKWITLNKDYGVEYRKVENEVEININKFGLSLDIAAWEKIHFGVLPTECIPDKEIKQLVWVRNKATNGVVTQLTLWICKNNADKEPDGMVCLANNINAATSMSAVIGRLNYIV